MAERLAPYLRYYSSSQPTDDHGAQPAVLVVLHDDIAQTHFLRVAREQMDRSGSKSPCWSPTGNWSSGRPRWDGPGLYRTADGSPSAPCRTVEKRTPYGGRIIMRLYYIDESEGPAATSASALGIDAERWNDLFGDIYEWRRELQERYAIPPDRELHACDLLAGRGLLARNGGASERLSPRQGAEVFVGGLRRIEDAAIRIGGVEVINVCIRKSDVKAYERVSLDRLLNRINALGQGGPTTRFLIFDEGKEKMINRGIPQAEDIQPRAQQIRAVGGGERGPGTSRRARHRRTRPSEAPTETISYRWRPHGPRPPQAGGGAGPQGGEHGYPRSLLNPRPRPE